MMLWGVSHSDGLGGAEAVCLVLSFRATCFLAMRHSILVML